MPFDHSFDAKDINTQHSILGGNKEKKIRRCCFNVHPTRDVAAYLPRISYVSERGALSIIPDTKQSHRTAKHSSNMATTVQFVMIDGCCPLTQHRWENSLVMRQPARQPCRFHAATCSFLSPLICLIDQTRLLLVEKLSIFFDGDCASSSCYSPCKLLPSIRRSAVFDQLPQRLSPACSAHEQKIDAHNTPNRPATSFVLGKQNCSTLLLMINSQHHNDCPHER